MRVPLVEVHAAQVLSVDQDAAVHRDSRRAWDTARPGRLAETAKLVARARDLRASSDSPDACASESWSISGRENENSRPVQAEA